MLKSTRRQFLRGTAGVAAAAVVPVLPAGSETPPSPISDEVWDQAVMYTSNDYEIMCFSTATIGPVDVEFQRRLLESARQHAPLFKCP